MKRPIAISLSPNASWKDAFLSLKIIFSPWLYFREEYTRNLEKWFKRFFGDSYTCVAFNSGRSSLYAILKSLDMKQNDEVITQAFTCVAVPNAILACAALPVYVDINNTFGIDPQDLQRKISPKTKAIIVQHTFGIPSEIDEIIRIAKRNNIAVIEDCAHVIGGEYKGRKLGSFGIASFFSFGRDKAFSSVWGGMAITKNNELAKKIRILQKQSKKPSFFWVLQQLFHPITFAFLLPVYNFLSVGKIVLVMLQKIHFLSFPVSEKEKYGVFERKDVRKMTNALSYLALSQLKHLKKFNSNRREIGKLYIEKIDSSIYSVPYSKETHYLRFPILFTERDDLVLFFKKRNILLGNWYSHIIDPKGTQFSKIHYEKGSCPKAQEYASKVINLPTYPYLSLNEASFIINLLNEYAQNHRNSR